MKKVVREIPNFALCHIRQTTKAVEINQTFSFVFVDHIGFRKHYAYCIIKTHLKKVTVTLQRLLNDMKKWPIAF